ITYRYAGCHRAVQQGAASRMTAQSLLTQPPPAMPECAEIVRFFAAFRATTRMARGSRIDARPDRPGADRSWLKLLSSSDRTQCRAACSRLAVLPVISLSV